jgi:hypothetical protein
VNEEIDEIKNLLRKLDENKAVREKEYIQAKALLQGIRLAKLNPQQEANTKLFEYFLDSFRKTEVEILSLTERHLISVARITELEKEVKKLRKTLQFIEENK